MATIIGGERVESEPSSREGTVYITARYVYKIFGKINLQAPNAKTTTLGNGEKSYEQYFKYKEAEAAGVPVSDTCKITTQLQVNGEVYTVAGIRSSRAHGQFSSSVKAVTR